MKLHKDFPLSASHLKRIISDIRVVYPESDAVYIVGTYARLNEKPSEKEHDVDILIHFPASINRTMIERRDDNPLWYKWSGIKAKPVIDFLLMFGKEEPKYGQHQWRLYHNMKTPKILVWRK